MACRPLGLPSTGSWSPPCCPHPPLPRRRLNGTVAAAQQLKRDQETGSGSEPASEDGTDGAAPAITMRSGEIFELEDDDYVFVDLPGSHLPKVGSS